MHRPPFGVGTRRQAGSELRQTADAAGQQRYVCFGLYDGGRRHETDPLTVVGVDDWAFRRNRHYGTIVCDLERRRIVTLLPDREVATVRAWLADHPGIKVVSRDRGGGYSEAAARALPDAIQVADRWHLMENASAAFLDAVRKSMRAIRSAIGSTTITPELLTWQKNCDTRAICGARIQLRQSWRSPATQSRSSRLSAAWVIVAISFARRCRGGRTDVFRTRQRSLDAYYLFLEGQWSGGCRNGAELWRRLQVQGFRGSLRSLASGQHVDVGRKRSANNSCKGYPRPELSPVL